MKLHHLLATALAGATLVAGCASPAPPEDTKTPGSAGPTQTPLLVQVRLDVSGTGRGNIRFSSDQGILIARDITLYGWTYSYTARPDAPVILEVFQPAPATSSCAVHISGVTKTSAAGTSPACTMKSI